MLKYKEQVILISDYIGDFGFSYKCGQTGIIGNPIDENDTMVMVLFDRYEEAKIQAQKMREEDGEGPNVVEYLMEIPIDILARSETLR